MDCLSNNSVSDKFLVSPSVSTLTSRTACSGPVEWFQRGLVATGVTDVASVFFADINGDGKEDYLVVGEKGDVNAWFNDGAGSNGVVNVGVSFCWFFVLHTFICLSG